MKETIIRFWSGLNTIGGNIISLENDGYRIITDFGAIGGANIDTLLDQSQVNGLLENQQLPKIDGVYPKDYLNSTDLIAYENSQVETIICLSHLHLDHIGSFGQLSPKVPVYALKESVDFYQSLKATHLLPTYNVNWQRVEPNGVIEFGPFTIQFVPVDHDTLGAASIFITAPDTKVIYSGDWRLTGFHPEKILSWADQARRFEADVLLMEGTTFSHVGSEPSEADHRIAAMTRSLEAKNEAQLLTALKAEVEHASNLLVAFNGYPQNVQRLVEFINVVNANGRTMVLDERYYQLMKPYLPSAADVIAFEEPLCIDKINQSPEKYALQVDIEAIDPLFNVQPGIYFHSNGMPLGSYDPSYEPFVKRVVDAGWDFVIANATGHATTNDLLLINRVIQPKVIVPWHTFQPETYGQALNTQGQTTWLPEYGMDYTWQQLQVELGVD